MFTKAFVWQALFHPALWQAGLIKKDRICAWFFSVKQQGSSGTMFSLILILGFLCFTGPRTCARAIGGIKPEVGRRACPLTQLPQFASYKWSFLGGSSKTQACKDSPYFCRERRGSALCPDEFLSQEYKYRHSKKTHKEDQRGSRRINKVEECRN